MNVLYTSFNDATLSLPLVAPPLETVKPQNQVPGMVVPLVIVHGRHGMGAIYRDPTGHSVRREMHER